MSDQPATPFGDAFSAFSKMMPGMDFLQQWTKSAGSALPGVGQWVAPTLDPQELEKRIQELRTVQFWLEQNARMISMSIQALEVQRMTLSTLKSMNVPMDALRESLRAKVDSAATAATAAATSYPWAPVSPPAAPPAAPEPAPAPPAAEAAPEAGDAARAGGAGPAADSGMVDPMRWWGSLTQQFASLAAQTVQDALRPGAAAAADAADATSSAPAARKAGSPAKAARAARKTPDSASPGPQAEAEPGLRTSHLGRPPRPGR